MSSMTKSDFYRVYTSAKQGLSLHSEMKRVHQLKENMRKRRKLMQGNMHKQGRKLEGENKFDVNKLVDSLKDFKYHIMPIDILAQHLKTDLKRGLTEEEAEKRLQEGHNEVQQVKETHWALLFLSQMSDPFSLLVWVIVVLAFIGYIILKDSNQLVLAILLIITLISGACISYGFVRSSSQQIKDFKEFFPKFTNAIREGETRILKSTQLVPGDIVLFMPGDVIPADIRIIKSIGMKINKATLTGESQPVDVQLLQPQKMQNPKNDSNLRRFNSENHNDGDIQNDKEKERNFNPLEITNMVFSGCVNVEGEGVGVVVSTGEKMLIARIRDVLVNSEGKQSYLEKEIARFVKIITIFSLLIGLYTFFGGWIIGFPVVIAANIAIGVTCASCPGILNLQLTSILYISTRNLANKSMIAKSLVAVQNLGSTEILCTDKTGTLTTNKMTISDLFYDCQHFKATNFEDYNPNYRHEYNVNAPTFIELQKCSILSSVADFNKSIPKDSITKITSRRDLEKSQKQLKIRELEKNWEEGFKKLKWSQKQVLGDSTESAFIRFFQPIQDIKIIRQKYPITIHRKQNKENRILFSSDKKYSLSINNDGHDLSSDSIVYVKGAPEVVWKMCDFIMVNGAKVPINPEIQQFCFNMIQNWGLEGKRIIACCCLHLRRQKMTPEKLMEDSDGKLKGMTFIGAVAMQDPPRRGIAETMLRIKKAGIKVIMITGDIESTAVSIARQCNIFTQQKSTAELVAQYGLSLKEALLKTQNVVINGDDLAKLITEDQFKLEHEKGRQFLKIIEKPNVIFTRASPSQKLFIVQNLQKLGFVVTIVGDGVNDSPAIKMANTGIAMASGSDAAREASDLIIGSDDLNNLIIGIEEGRRVFDNFKKAICYVMTSQVSEWMPFVFLILSKIPIPIFTLLVDGATDFIPTLAFAYQESEEGIMTRPPKFKDDNLVNFRLIAQSQGWMGMSSFLCCLFSYFIIMVDFGFVPSDLWGKSNDFILLENRWDNYNPTSKYFGNSNLEQLTSCTQFDSKKVRVDWINASYPATDLRMSGVRCRSDEKGGIFFEQYYKFAECKMQQISIYTFKPICYTPEATKYAQSSYMFANVINQIFNWIICRTRKDSAILKRFNNPIFICGLGAEAMLGFSLAYTTPWIWIIGTRDVAFQHFGIAAIPFSLIQLTLDEIRKYLVRNLPPNQNGKPNWFVRNTLW